VRVRYLAGIRNRPPPDFRCIVGSREPRPADLIGGCLKQLPRTADFALSATDAKRYSGPPVPSCVPTKTIAGPQSRVSSRPTRPWARDDGQALASDLRRLTRFAPASRCKKKLVARLDVESLLSVSRVRTTPLTRAARPRNACNVPKPTSCRHRR
jgi:hypothetical protein